MLYWSLSATSKFNEHFVTQTKKCEDYANFKNLIKDYVKTGNQARVLCIQQELNLHKGKARKANISHSVVRELEETEDTKI